MKIQQISVFLENKRQRLYEVCRLLGRAHVNIRAMNIAEAAQYSLLRMVVDRPGHALHALREHGVVASTSEVIIVEVGDRPGSLAEILRILQENEIDVEYMYGFFERGPDRALLVFRLSDPDEAMLLFEKNHVRIAMPEDLGA